MTDLFLIAHKVRNEPAFDVAQRVECPICKGDYDIDRDEESLCTECDDTGYWWIIPTSGHRAYPWWSAKFEDIDDTYQLDFEPTTLEGPGSMPPSLPDHYATRSAPTFDLSLALKSLAPTRTIRRR